MNDMSAPRILTSEDQEHCVPVYVVWETTLACNLKCGHCGSRAGARRDDELDTPEALELIDQMAALGTREITIIGGEAFLRKDWLRLIERIAGHGILCTMQTGAYGLNEKMLKSALDAGLGGIGVSVDGREDDHDRIRGRKGSFRACLKALRAARDLGMVTSANTQINAISHPHLRAIFDVVADAGISHWQLQWTVAMGNAADNDDVLLQPYLVKPVMDEVAEIFKHAQTIGVTVRPGNNIGYFGKHEVMWRGGEQGGGHYAGCPAGHNAIGIEADGTIKACPSLPKERYSGGNIRDLTLEDMWKTAPGLAFNRQRGTDHLWGHCKGCMYADICHGGCTWTADSLFQRPGNNPYCYYRVDKLEKQGIRERVRKVQEAPDHPFAVGLFEIVEEPI